MSSNVPNSTGFALELLKKLGLDKTAAQLGEEEKQIVVAQNKILSDQLVAAEQRITELERIVHHLADGGDEAGQVN